MYKPCLLVILKDRDRWRYWSLAKQRFDNTKSSHSKMIVSRFTSLAFLVVALAISITWLLYAIISKAFVLKVSPPNEVCVFAGICLVLWVWLVFGVLRKKAIKVSLNNRLLEKRGFLGLGLKQQFDLSELDGFSIAILYARGGRYEYLYVLKGKNSVVTISEFYHSNYFEVKRELESKLKFTGKKTYSLLDEIKNIFR